MERAQVLHSLNESLCHPSPSDRAEAVPTDQAEIVRADSDQLECRSTEMPIILPPLVLTMGRACSALRSVVDGLQDLHSIRWTNHSAIHPHPVESRLCRRTRLRIVQADQLDTAGALQCWSGCRHPCERWAGLVQPCALSPLDFRT